MIDLAGEVTIISLDCEVDYWRTVATLTARHHDLPVMLVKLLREEVDQQEFRAIRYWSLVLEVVVLEKCPLLIVFAPDSLL